MPPLTLFTFGYWGWGNATRELVQAVDAVETSRGFQPPVFVDTRLRRSVRAKGFNGNAFAAAPGDSRYVWMQGLGNLAVAREAGTGPAIEIKDPGSACHLLDRAIDCQTQNRRVLFFCACEYPAKNGEPDCHRHEVARLVLGEARRRGLAVEIVEWPDGEPEQLDLEVEPKVLRVIRKGGVRIPLGPDFPGSRLCGLPWGSVVTVRALGDQTTVLAGRAAVGAGKWYLPVFPDEADPESDWLNAASQIRQRFGLAPRCSNPT